jgi:hydrogenase maturation protease
MANRDSSPAIVVLGLGNLLLGDDGVGVHAVRAIDGRLPVGVIAAEAGTAILRAEHLIEAADYIVAFDAMRAGGAPGSVYMTSLDNVADEFHGSESLHDLTLVSVMRHLRRKPRRSLVIAAEPQIIEIGMELSACVSAAVPRMVDTALRIIDLWRGGRRVPMPPFIDLGAESNVPCHTR